jgi:hypothetical protein
VFIRHTDSVKLTFFFLLLRRTWKLPGSNLVRETSLQCFQANYGTVLLTFPMLVFV